MSVAYRSLPAAAPALWILAAIATLFFLRAASTLFVPIVIGVLISYALEPVVAWLERHKVRRAAGATLLLLAIVGLSAWGMYALKDDVVAVIESLPRAAERARDLVVSRSASGPAADIREAANVLQTGERNGTAPLSGSTAATDAVQRAVALLWSIAGTGTVIFFLVLFLLVSGNHFRQRLIEIAGPQLERRKISARIIDDIDTQVQRFLAVTVFVAVIVALATWAVLAWMQVEQALLWGILAGVFNSIPYFGPVIVSGGLLVVGLVQTGDAMEAMKISGAALAISTLEGWLITPQLMGKAERMNVVVVFVGLLLWTWLWGGWGTILAVPMLVVVKSVADHVDGLKPLARLMAP